MGFIHKHFRMSDEERRKVICDVIRHKCKYRVSNTRLDYIVARLNLSRTYFIKATNDPFKFLNVATSEHIDTSDRHCLSQVIPIYGEFTPGYFVKTDLYTSHLVKSTMNTKKDAAALKTAVSYLPGGSVSATYMLVLYETGRGSV